MSTGGRSGWRRGLFAALAAALVLGALLPLPGRRAGERERVDGIGVAAAGETSPIRLAQRIRRGPTEEETPPPAPAAPEKPEPEKSELAKQGQADADRKSTGCVTCHTKTDSPSMHTATTVKLGCIDCHGGKVEVRAPEGVAAGSPTYEAAKKQAHVLPKNTEVWRTSANPTHSYTAILQESQEFIQFVNPGDLRVAPRTCGPGGCHPTEVAQVEKSMMKTGPMLWAAALYNNGGFPIKRPTFGEAYGPDGLPQRVVTLPPPTVEETVKKGVLAWLDPLPRFEVGQPGNVLRVFERGQERPLDIGVPTLNEPPGKPANRLSQRGLGTLNRIDPVWLNLQKTRLFDPALSLLGNNEHPGEFRSSGCTGCHVIYANDRSPAHSVEYAQYGNRGLSASADPTIPKNEPGHPIRHQFTNSIPSSQCVVCHHHPGTTVTNSYLGTTWWDNETDGNLMYPAQEHKLTPTQVADIQRANPEGAALRGLWSDKQFLDNVTDLNPKLTRTQFADFHGHGWVFRNVYKTDRKGHLLDGDNKVVAADDPERFNKAVHLKDIHLEKGMHCSDCHFKQDAHGNGKVYGETRAAIEITCVDCHGSINAKSTLKTSGPAAPAGGSDLSLLTTPFGQRRFQWRGDTLIQRSTVTKDLQWEVVQVLDSIDPASAWSVANPKRSERSRLAKTIRRDGTTWGDAPAKDSELAHADSKMTCFACHTSWVTSCFGCHLPMKANERKPLLHNEGTTLRNWTPYNFQTIRDDVFMLAVDGTTAGKRLSPARSTCAVLVGSQNGQREWVYSQQQTVSAEGFSGQLVQHVRAAHGAVDRDQVLHRLSRVEGQRQQRLDGVAAHAGHELLQLHRTLRLRGGGRQGARGGRGHRARRAAGGDRQLPAQGRLSHQLRHASRRRRSAAGQGPPPRPRRAGCLRQGRGALHPAPRRVPLHGQRPRGLPRLRRGAGRSEGVLREDRHRAGLATRPAPLREDQVRHRGGLSLDAGRRSHPHPASGERGAEDPPGLRVSVRERPRGRAGGDRQSAGQPQPPRRVDAAGRRPRQQLPGAGAGLQPRRPAHRRGEHHGGRPLCLRAGVQGALRGRPRQPAAAADRGHRGRARISSSRAPSPSSSATPS